MTRPIISPVLERIEIITGVLATARRTAELLGVQDQLPSVGALVEGDSDTMTNFALSVGALLQRANGRLEAVNQQSHERGSRE
jgi:hypothetical protein